MIILTNENKIVNTDSINRIVNYAVLSFEDFREPDYYFRELTEIEEFNSASITLEIGPYRIVVPLHWWVLCSDFDYVQTLPLYELSRIDHMVFCFNPLTSFTPKHLPLRVSSLYPSIYPSTNWTCPPIAERDLILYPLGYDDSEMKTGPICAMFSPNKYDLTCASADLW